MVGLYGSLAAIPSTYDAVLGNDHWRQKPGSCLTLLGQVSSQPLLVPDVSLLKPHLATSAG